ncbi:hypothetical protein, partial [Staphylococcus aureus]
EFLKGRLPAPTTFTLDKPTVNSLGELSEEVVYLRVIYRGFIPRHLTTPEEVKDITQGCLEHLDYTSVATLFLIEDIGFVVNQGVDQVFEVPKLTKVRPIEGSGQCRDYGRK